jgi:hypothetical protein
MNEEFGFFEKPMPTPNSVYIMPGGFTILSRFMFGIADMRLIYRKEKYLDHFVKPDTDLSLWKEFEMEECWFYLRFWR